MKIEVIAFGIAKDILNGNQVTLEVESESSVADVRQSLPCVSRACFFAVSRKCRLCK